MCKRFLMVLLPAVLLLSVSFVSADKSKPEITSLAVAETVVDVTGYVTKKTAEINKIRAKSADEFVKNSREIGELSIAGGDKILKISDDKSEQDRGFELKISGLKKLIQADRVAARQKSGITDLPQSESQKKLDALLDDLEKDGRIPLVTNGERYSKFTLDSQSLLVKFSQEKFDAFVQKAKEWSVKKPVKFKPAQPLLQVVYVAASVAVKNDDSKLLRDTLSDLIAFVDSKEFDLPDEDKKNIHKQLADHAAVTSTRARYAKFTADAVSLQNEFDADKFDSFVVEAKKWAAAQDKNVKPTQPLLKVLEVATAASLTQNDSQFFDKTLKTLTDFVKSDELNLPEKDKAEILGQLTGYSSRIVGAKPEIYGKTLDDKDFSWTDLRGKYVLVKFTASWCGPCKGEIPGMLSAYEKYHDKGLEIVSIYVWDKLDATKKIVDEEKLPWIILSEELTEKAGQPLQGKKFAVTGVPTMFLVNKEGKVIFTEARGEKLQKKLEELFSDKNNQN
ncbi:MAG: TlpA family protein disulfide reductase [Planctomycetaceae bacterium]|jgi:thiol-disulfide isomerase/thioredoxin|nr:TlpA family protein disulfide reductase [Planctomycetaceae bacterium]